MDWTLKTHCNGPKVTRFQKCSKSETKGSACAKRSGIAIHTNHFGFEGNVVGAFSTGFRNDGPPPLPMEA